MSLTSVIPIIFFSLFGGIISNFFSHNIILNKEIKLDKKILSFYLIPFLILFVDIKIIRKNRIKLFLSHLLGIVSFLIFGFSLENIFKTIKDINYFEVISVSVLMLVILLYFLYLAIYDLFYFEIPVFYTKQLILVVIIANIVIGLSKLINFEIFKVNAFDFINLGTYQSLFGLLAGYILTYLLVRYSNEKALGDGDIEINAIVGAILGFKFLFIYFFIALLIGTITGISYSLIIRKVKDVLVPLVPILLLAFVICLGFSDNIYKLIFLS